MSNNIRTISQLDDLKLNNFSELSSANLYLEVSKNNGTINTYKLSIKNFLTLLFDQIHVDGDKRWVTTSGNDIQHISSPKKFNENIQFGDNAKIEIINDVATISCNNTIIEGTARRAYWA